MWKTHPEMWKTGSKSGSLPLQTRRQALVANPGQQPFNLCLFSGGDGQQGGAGAASVVAVEVAAVLYARDAQLADDAPAGIEDALLLLSRKLAVCLLYTSRCV